MGGYGSGRWYRGSSKSTTDASKQLDIRLMKKQGWLVPGLSSTLSWSTNGKHSGSIGYTVYDDRLVLNYSCTPYGQEESIPVTQSILFEETDCNYGGIRKWFHCPHCGKRREVLYLNGRYFICRKCADLNYECQHEQPLDRNYRQARKIRQKLVTNIWKGTHLEFNPNNLSHKPIFKPKGMHQKTWDRLRFKQTSKIDIAMRQLASKIGLNLN